MEEEILFCSNCRNFVEYEDLKNVVLDAFHQGSSSIVCPVCGALCSLSETLAFYAKSDPQNDEFIEILHEKEKEGFKNIADYSADKIKKYN